MRFCRRQSIISTYPSQRRGTIHADWWS